MATPDESQSTLVYFDERIESRYVGVSKKFGDLLHNFERFLGTVVVQIAKKQNVKEIDASKPVFFIVPVDSVYETGESRRGVLCHLCVCDETLELERTMVCAFPLEPSSRNEKGILICENETIDSIVEKLFQKFWESSIWRGKRTDRLWAADRIGKITKALPMPKLEEDDDESDPYKNIFDEFPEIKGIAFGWSGNPWSVFYGGEILEGRLVNELNADEDFAKLLRCLKLPPLARPDGDEAVTIRIYDLDRENRLISVGVFNSPNRPHIFWHMILSKISVRTTALEALVRVIHLKVENMALSGHAFLRNLQVKEFYNRSRFERNLIETALNIRKIIFFSPENSEALLRRLAINYSCYIRDAFGTRLSPEILSHIPHMIHQKENDEKIPGNKCNNEIERNIEEQAEFLASAAAIAIMISKGVDGIKTLDSVEKSSVFDNSLYIFSYGNLRRQLPIVGHLLLENCRPYQRLFIEMFLLDCAGTMAILREFFELPKFKEVFEKILGIDKNEVIFEDLIDIIKQALDQVYSFKRMKPGENADQLRIILTKRLIAPVEFDCCPIGGKKSKKEQAKQEKLAPWSICHLHDLVSRWLRLIVPLEIEALQGEQLFSSHSQLPGDGKKQNPVEKNCSDDTASEPEGTECYDLERLWDDTASLLWGWLWFHKQWSKPDLVLSREKTDKIRKKLLMILKKKDSSSKTMKQKKKEEGHSDDLFLHVDSLWLNMYLLRSLFQYIPYNKLHTDYFPNSFLALNYIKKLGDLTIYVLWSLIDHEQNPGDYTFLSSKVENRDQGDMTTHLLNDRVKPVTAPRYTEVLIDLIDIYAHYVLKLPFEVHVSRYLNWVLESQAILYSLKDHYRDHLFHVIDVFLLGDFLLRCRMGKMQEYVQNHFRNALNLTPTTGKDGTKTEKEMKAPDVFQNWCIAGLFHDIGYSLMLYGMVPKVIEEHATDAFRPFVDGMKDALNGNLEDLEKKIKNDFECLVGREGKIGNDHGALSTLMIRDHLKQLDLSIGEEQLLAPFTPSLEAIFLHNLSHRPIPMEEFPLGYLLTLCDEIQDWGRYRVDISKFRRDVALSVNMPANWQIRSTPVLSELLLEIENVNGDDFVLRTKENPWENARAEINLYQIYKSADPELLDPLLLWVGKTMNLERLQQNNWSRINLHIITHVPERMKRMELTYKDLLSRVAERVPGLNLRRFVHILEQMEQMARLKLNGEQNNRKFLQDLLPGMYNHEIDIAVLNLDKIAEEHPLRAFDRDKGFQQLLQSKEEILREIGERYRFQGRVMWRVGGDTERL